MKRQKKGVKAAKRGHVAKTTDNGDIWDKAARLTMLLQKLAGTKREAAQILSITAGLDFKISCECVHCFRTTDAYMALLPNLEGAEAEPLAQLSA